MDQAVGGAAEEAQRAASGTHQLTCFTSMKVQIRTPEELCARRTTRRGARQTRMLTHPDVS